MTVDARPGLSAAEAAERLEVHGPNLVPGPPPTPVRLRVLRQLRDPLMVVLLVAAVLTVATGDYPDAAIIALVVVANTAVGVAQEVRADAAIAALSSLTAPVARVRRDGEVAVVPAVTLVPGDVVLLGEGDIVPADALVLEQAALVLDESAVTGESVAVAKAAAGPDRAGDTLSAGTVVVRGRAVAVVTATGARSAVGRIAALMTAPPPITPLQRRLIGLGRTLAAGGAALCLAVLALGLAQGRSTEIMVVTAVSLLVAAVPESLPAVVTLALALGARRMADRQAIVRRLPAVETLGSVTVIATDKTGTLTEGRMVVEWLWTPDGDAAVTGSGYSPDGAVLTDAGPVRAADAPHLAALLEAAVLCNDAALRPPAGPDGEWGAAGDPTEAAMVAAAARFGIVKATLDRRLPRVAEVPFDSERQRMTTVHRLPDGRRRVVCKGAPEAVLPLVDGDPAGVSAAAARADAYATGGHRVLAVATADRDGADDGEPEGDLTLVGLLALADPPRPDAAMTLARCRAAGILPVLVTGDHVATAQAVATRLGLMREGDAVATGAQLLAGEVPDVTAVRVFARTAPEQKVAVVEAWQRAGHVVAMTGDGVNDGPALRRADIGVAMGRRGTEVARQAADLVLADDDLATVVDAVEEGRRIYANVRRFLLYGLAGGTAEVLLMLLGPAFGLLVPLLPAQILWVNLVTHGLPGVALGAEPAEPDAMRRPPRPASEHVLGDGLATRIAALCLVVTGVSLGAGVWAHDAGRSWQSMVFVALAATQLAVALGVRVRATERGNRFLVAAVAGALGLQLAAVYLPPLQDLLDTEPLSSGELLSIAALSVLGWAGARLATRRRVKAVSR